MPSENYDKWILQCPVDPKCISSFPTVGLALWDKIKKLGNNIAHIDSHTDISDTYEEVLSRSVRTALALKERINPTNDIISICSYNHRDTWTPMLAAYFINARISAIDPSLSIENATNLLNITKPRIMFCVPEALDLVTTAINNISLNCEIVVFGETDKYIPFQEFLKENKEEKNFTPQPVDPMSTAAIFFSSGTTGMPKAVCLNHSSLLYQINNFSKHVNASVMMVYSSPYWISNTMFKISTILQKGKQILRYSFDANIVPKLTEKYKVTIIFAALTSMPYINWKTNDVPSLESIILGGSIVPNELNDKLRKEVPHANAINIYGMTETSGVCTMFDPISDKELMKLHIHSCGKIVAGVTAKVVDVDTGEIVGPNCRGEFLVQSKYLMNGYYNNPEQTKEAFDKDGFYKSGDIVYYDEDHCFYVVDRLKETFKTRSHRIIPSELESILLDHPKISEAVVIGIPHKIDGDWPMAIVVLKDGKTCNENDIVDYFDGQVIDNYKLRAGVKIVKNIVKTSTGKYCRYKLRQMILSGEI